jgi:ribosomal protein L37AE/L43A
MGRFICPKCKTALRHVVDRFGNRLWCPKCRRFLTDIASDMGKRRIY